MAIYLDSKARRLAKKIVVGSRALRCLARIMNPRVLILRYHSVCAVPHEYTSTIGSGIIHSEEVFAKQMEIVARRCTPVTLDDIAEGLSANTKLPRRAVAVTFDDGFRDNYTVAAPILNSLGVKGAFYVTTGAVDDKRPPWFCVARWCFHNTNATSWTDTAGARKYDLRDVQGRRDAFVCSCRHLAQLDGVRQANWVNDLVAALDVNVREMPSLMMTWEQIRQLAIQGHVVGAHTCSHPNLAQIAVAAVMHECRTSKQQLEHNLERPIHHFAYPSPILQPHWNQATIEVTRQCGFQTAVTSNAGPVDSTACAWSLPRVSAAMDVDLFNWNLEASFCGRTC